MLKNFIKREKNVTQVAQKGRTYRLWSSAGRKRMSGRGEDDVKGIQRMRDRKKL